MENDRLISVLFFLSILVYMSYHMIHMTCHMLTYRMIQSFLKGIFFSVGIPSAEQVKLFFSQLKIPFLLESFQGLPTLRGKG